MIGFVLVISDSVKAVAAGTFHSMVLEQGGSIWATGSNKDGQFGDGSIMSSTSFVRLAPFSNGSTNDHTHVLMALQLLNHLSFVFFPMLWLQSVQSFAI